MTPRKSLQLQRTKPADDTFAGWNEVPFSVPRLDTLTQLTGAHYHSRGPVYIRTLKLYLY